MPTTASCWQLCCQLLAGWRGPLGSITASEVAASTAAPDARAHTAGGENISAADYRTLHTYVSRQERGRQAFVLDLAGDRT